MDVGTYLNTCIHQRRLDTYLGTCIPKYQIGVNDGDGGQLQRKWRPRQDIDTGISSIPQRHPAPDLIHTLRYYYYNIYYLHPCATRPVRSSTCSGIRLVGSTHTSHEPSNIKLFFIYFSLA